MPDPYPENAASELADRVAVAADLRIPMWVAGRDVVALVRAAYMITDPSTIRAVETGMQASAIEARIAHNYEVEWGSLMRGPPVTVIGQINKVVFAKIDLITGTVAGQKFELNFVSVVQWLQKKGVHRRPSLKPPCQPRRRDYSEGNDHIIKIAVEMVKCAPGLSAASAVKTLLDGKAEIIVPVAADRTRVIESLVRRVKGLLADITN